MNLRDLGVLVVAQILFFWLVTSYLASVVLIWLVQC